MFLLWKSSSPYFLIFNKKKSRKKATFPGAIKHYSKIIVSDLYFQLLFTVL